MPFILTSSPGRLQAALYDRAHACLELSMPFPKTLAPMHGAPCNVETQPRLQLLSMRSARISAAIRRDGKPHEGSTERPMCL